jgi:hypothetical protein
MIKDSDQKFIYGGRQLCFMVGDAVCDDAVGATLLIPGNCRTSQRKRKCNL